MTPLKIIFFFLDHYNVVIHELYLCVYGCSGLEYFEKCINNGILQSNALVNGVECTVEWAEPESCGKIRYNEKDIYFSVTSVIDPQTSIDNIEIKVFRFN
jgi:hypothetical protein